MPNDSLVKIATYDDPILPHLARNQLEAENIAVFLDGEHHVAMDWMIANAVGGIKLLVAAEDQEQALEILKRRTESDSAEEQANSSEEAGDELPCPSCRSPETYRERLKRKLIFLSILFLGVPFPFISRQMICDSCGHKWNPAAVST